MPYITRSVTKQDLGALYERLQCWDLSYILKERLFTIEGNTLIDKIKRGKTDAYKLRKLIKFYKLLKRDLPYMFDCPTGCRYASYAAFHLKKGSDVFKDLNNGRYSHCDPKLVQKCRDAITDYNQFLYDCIENCMRVRNETRRGTRYDQAVMTLKEFGQHLTYESAVTLGVPSQYIK